MLTMGGQGCSSPLAALASKASLLAEQLGTGLYTGCAEVEVFPAMAETIRMKHAYWTAELKKYGTSGENLVAPIVQAATKRLREEETRLRKLHSSCYMQCFASSRFMFPKDLAASIKGVIDVLENLPLLLKDSFDNGSSEEDSFTTLSLHRDVEGYSKLINEPEFEDFDGELLLEQQRPRSKLRKRSELPFTGDKRYVPVDSFVAEVQRSLERADGPHVVVLQGGPGTGKSSLAKQLALHYDHDWPGAVAAVAAHAASPSSSSSLQYFSDGVFYLSCSGAVDIKAKQLELLYVLDYPLHLLLTSGESQHLTGAEIHKKLVEHMNDRNALVVLDNVEDCDLLQHLLVPSPRVKYLVTSEVKLLWADTLSLRVPQLKMDDARKVLAQHLDLDLPSGQSEPSIPSHLQVAHSMEGLASSLTNSIRKHIVL